jgi:hypothetical protein
MAPLTQTHPRSSAGTLTQTQHGEPLGLDHWEVIMALALYTVRGGYVPGYGSGSAFLIAPDPASALRDAEGYDFLISEAREITVTREFDAYCGHDCATGSDRPGVWECDTCPETWTDASGYPDASATHLAFRTYCESLVERGLAFR